MIGSTDAHTGLAAVEEDNFFGKTSAMEPSADARPASIFVKGKGGTIMGWETSASGYAAVWATENTREAIFDAMERRETYATTGPRMLVRFFGGYDFEAGRRRTLAALRWSATRKGVPMGGDLGPAPAGKAPTFLVAALKDPIGANLDRYQIVKGWVDAKGEMQEKVYDVAWSGDRKPGCRRQAAAGRQHRRRGERHLDQHHRRARTDRRLEGSGFRSEAARLLLRARASRSRRRAGRPTTPNTSACKMAPEVPMPMQERAYTSPIWYSPSN